MIRCMNSGVVLAAVCGLATTWTAAQQQTNPGTQPTNPDRRVQPRTTSSTPGTMATDASRILQRLDGLWTVEIQMHPDAWNKKQARDTRSVTEKSAGTGATGTSGDQSTPNRTTDATRTPGQPSTPGSTANPAGQEPNSAGLTMRLTGSSEINCSLNGRLLQEECRLEQGSQSTSSTTGSTTGTSPSSESDMTSAMTIALDPQTTSFHILHVHDGGEKTEYKAGSYSVQGDRLEFNTSPDSDWNRTGSNWNQQDSTRDTRTADRDGVNDPTVPRILPDPARPATGQPPADPTQPTTPRQPGQDPMAGDQQWRTSQAKPVRVVLEILNENSYRVMMYGSGPSTLSGTSADQPSREAAAPGTNTPGTTTTPRTTRTTPGTNASGEGQLISIATYTRASGDSAEFIRSKFNTTKPSNR